MYQKFVRFWFRFFQKRLARPTNSEGCELHTDEDIMDAIFELLTYKDIEVSKVTHNIGEPDQYMCLLYVGKNKGAVATKVLPDTCNVS